MSEQQLNALAQALGGREAAALFDAVADVAGDAIGYRMLTVMRYNDATSELRRVFSNNAEDYPVGGNKVKEASPWKQRLLVDCKPVLSNSPAAVKENFNDFAKLSGLGIEAILNIPVVSGGRCIGTLNFGHQAGWFEPRHIEIGTMLAAQLLPALDAPA